MTRPTADAVRDALRAVADPDDVDYVARFYAGDLPENRILGVRMPKVFPIAKAARDMDLAEVEMLLDDPHHEMRMAAVTILDAKGRSKRLKAADRQAILDLYLRRHDRIDNWDHVDRAAPFVVGEALVDGDRSLLDRLARSARPTERRTALVATYAFLKRGETADTFRIADILADDPDPYVQKALGSWLREAGKRDAAGLAAFLKAAGSRLAAPTRKTLAK